MKNQRQNQIIEILKENGYASTAKLAKTLYSSLPTIRRDLIALENAGYLVRSHGGASLPPNTSILEPIDFRRINHRAEKQIICATAKNYLKDYQVIFFDESTTLLPLIKYLSSLKNAIIITNGIDALNELKNTNLHFYCTGGKGISNNNLVGRLTEQFISQFNIDVCFFSTTCISNEGQIMDVVEEKVGIVRSLIKHSKQRIYLCDHSKIGLTSKFNVTTASDIDLIITDAPKGTFNLPQEKVIYCK